MDDPKSDVYTKKLLEYVESPPNPRDIFWLWSDKGATGKSTRIKWLKNYLVEKGEKVLLCRTARSLDLAYLYNNETTVLIDCPKSKKTEIPYEFMEMVKDCEVTSTKYTPQMKKPKKMTHIVVCANQPPEYHLIAEDRFIVVNCDIPAEIPLNVNLI